MNLILVGCCVAALSIFGKRSLRNAMMKLGASKEPESVDSNNDVGTTTDSMGNHHQPSSIRL